MTLQDKINLFINRVQQRIAANAIPMVDGINAGMLSPEIANETVELLDFLECLTDELNDWTPKIKELYVDYYSLRHSLVSMPIASFSNYTEAVSSSTGSSDWQDAFNALNTTVSQHIAYTKDEIDRLDQRIDNLDFSNLVPQELLDQVQANTDDSHSHDNKSVLDQITQVILDEISAATTHVNDGSVHVTATNKSTWNGKVSQTELSQGLAGKANSTHNHQIADVEGLQQALTDNAGSKGDKGDSPVMQAGTIQDGVYAISIDNTNPLAPVLHLVVPQGVDGTDGSDFHIDEYGNAADRLAPAYDNEDEGYSYLGVDDGMMYLRNPYDGATFIPASSPTGWHSFKFLGYTGWSPVLSTYVVSETKTVLKLYDWVGGEGPKPSVGVNTYIGPNGFTQSTSEATNVRGAIGPTGSTGKAVFPDVSGIGSERSNYDGEVKDFMFLDTETGRMFIKRSDTPGDWSAGYQWTGLGNGGSVEPTITRNITVRGVGSVGGFNDDDILEESTKMTDAFARLLQVDTPPSLNVSLSRSGTQEINSTNSVTVTPSFTANDAGAITQVRFYRNNVLQHTQADTSAWTDSNYLFAANTTWKVEVDYAEGGTGYSAGTIEASRTLSVDRFIYYGPYGTVDPEDGSDLTSLQKTALSDFTYNTNLTATRYVIAMKDSKSLVEVLDGYGFNITGSYVLSGTINTMPDPESANYSIKCYILTTAQPYPSVQTHSVNT